jgi:hypothetical protein
VYLRDRDTYAWFRERAPIAKIGYSVFIYDVPRIGGEPVSVSLSGLSLQQIDEQTFADAFGTNDLRLRWFDARGALVFPGEEWDSWVAVTDTAPPAPPLWEQFFADVPVWGQRTSGDERLSYTLYRFTPEMATKLLDAVQADTMDVWYSPATTFEPGYERHPLLLPADLGDFQFLGDKLLADHVRPGGELSLFTVWRLNRPVAPPAALFVHLLDPEGHVRGQHDGLSVDLVGLEAGDVLVQLHRVALPQDLVPGEYPLEIGVYRPDTMERWQVYQDTDAIANRLLLRPVRVEAQ